MMSVACASADELWHHTAAHCLQEGNDVGEGKELLGFCGRLTNPLSNVVWNEVLDFSPTEACSELLRTLGDSEHSIGLLVQNLREDPDTRRAVITSRRGTLQFVNRGGFLHLLVTMRECDVWRELPTDLFALSTLQRLIAAALDLGIGFYQQHVGTLYVQSSRQEVCQDALGLIPMDAWVVFGESGNVTPLLRQIETALEFHDAFDADTGGNAEYNLETLGTLLGNTPMAGIAALAALRGMRELGAEELAALDNACPRNLLTRALRQLEKRA